MTSSVFVLAAGAAPPFFGQIAVLLVASAAVAFVCHRFGVTPIVSFLVTGALIGPHALGLVEDGALIEAAAEVGVMLLLFTIGIEFSLEKLGRIQRLIFVGGGLQVGLVVAAVMALGVLFDVPWRAGLFTGFLVALSSTAIVMKLLMSRAETDSTGGQASLGILIFQDLAVVAMVLLVPILGGEGGSAPELAWALGKAVGIVLLVLLVARRGMPIVLEAVARTCSQEIFLLTVIAICFGTAWLTSLAGVSLSLGAFLAGLVVSESRFSEMAFGEILPLQILFSATFFVSVGLLLDLGFLVANLPLVLAVVLVVLLVKALGAGLSVLVLGYGLGTAAYSGLMLAQVGEFSFVLERAGREVGLFPAGIEAGAQTFIAATVILMIATPYLSLLGARLEARRTRRGAARRRADVAPPSAGGDAGADHAGLRGHVLIAGYGAAGRALARALADRELPHLVVTLSPDGAHDAERHGHPVLPGNYLRQHELRLAGLDAARLLVVADDDLATTHRVVAAARALRPDLPVLARTRFESEVRALRDAGARSVVAEERESIAALVAEVLGVYGGGTGGELPASPSRAAPSPNDPDALRLTERQRANTRCTHLALAGAVVPTGSGCVDCLKTGDTWVHLRLCMTCGHVGCCDDSKNRHASRHAEAASHPIARSFEPGEDWAWCYVDELML